MFSDKNMSFFEAQANKISLRYIFESRAHENFFQVPIFSKN
jgi:hypothetical protein